LLLAVLPACQTTPKNKVLVVPDEMRRTAPPSSSSAARAKERPPPLTPPQKYILRMAEAGRVWEVELPEGEGGYEVRLPIAGGGPVEMLTAADEEMLAESLQDAKQKQEPQPTAEQKKPTGEQKPANDERVVDANKKARTRSLLGGMARVKEMYASHRYEMALVALVDLETEYPNNARLLAMKGSLYLKLGEPKKARQAWEQALSINPNDLVLAEALRTIAAGEE
jgi:tetratricopeptide (TPR) repeat protein